MKKSTTIFIDKMIQSKKLEEEAIISLFPESMQNHLKVINQEIHAILVESAVSFASETNKNEKDQTSSSVKKVEIG